MRTACAKARTARVQASQSPASRAALGVSAPARPTPVSYTHLDVYKRQAVVKTGVTKATDYLVAGRRDQDPTDPKSMSTKEQKARQLTEAGKANITVLSEEEFMEMVGETSHV